MASNFENLGKITAYGPRQTELDDSEMQAQIDALKAFVEAAHNQLKTHGVEEDSDKYTARFLLQDSVAVMVIKSVRDPSEASHSGLFVYIQRKDAEGYIEQLLGVQTAKIPDIVNADDALWLSSYKPHQLHELAELINGANPLDKAAYYAYFSSESEQA